MLCEKILEEVCMVTVVFWRLLGLTGLIPPNPLGKSMDLEG